MAQLGQQIGMPLKHGRAKYRRVIAVLSTIVAPSIGHVVMGHARRGALWLCASIFVTAIALIAIISAAPHLAWMLFILLLAIRVASILEISRIPLKARSQGTLSTIVLISLMVVVGGFTPYSTEKLIRAHRIPGSTMYPTLQVGDDVFTSQIFLKLGRGDVIAFEYPLDKSKTFVKRIIGIPGDTVEIRHGQLILNNAAVLKNRTDESCVVDQRRCTVWLETLDGRTRRFITFDDQRTVDASFREFGSKRIPAGSYFVLGDNRDYSLDSRHWGVVPFDLVRGNPLFVFWATDKTGIRLNRINEIIE